ncbi:ring canal kelch-like protein [Dinothrombium tinctorium]|uniref:Ring canal kelch-like protein n=1 Tax=Dinothrombium tinctorium TaxID=1965070 RepID=A0A443QDL3_9ACAR|nr:ring canal kelch-like protein [Dinothrombium tinctorium]
MEKINKNTTIIPSETKFNTDTYIQVFGNKFKGILFKEPYFGEYLKDVKLNIKPADECWDEKEQQFYTRYFASRRMKTKSDVIKRHLQGVREVQSHKLVNFIKDCYKHNGNIYSDIQIHIDDEVFMAHRLILACFIPFLFHRLSRSERPQETRKLRLTGISAKAFQIIIQYIYTGVVQPTKDNFLTVLETALKFLMNEFAETWMRIYDEILGTTTARILFRYQMAKKFTWNDYSDQLVRVLALSFENLLTSDEFMKLTFEELLDILKQDEMGVESEVVIFIAVLKWLGYEWQERRKYAVSLMNEVRFPFMNEEVLFACFNPPILKEVIAIQEIKNMIADALK